MKIRELIFISLASFVISASAVEPQRFTVRGNIEDIPDGVVLNLYEENGNLLTTVGQDTVSDGSFCITDTISSPTKSLFLSSDTPGFPNWLAKIIVAPGSVTTVTGKGFLHPLWRYTSDIPRQESIRGFVTSTMPEFEDYLKLSVEEKKLISYLFIEKKGAEEYIKPTWQKIDSIRRLAEPFEAAMNKKKLEYMAYAPVDDEWLEVYRNYVSEAFRNPDMENAAVIKSLYSRLSADDLATPDGMAVSQLFDNGRKLCEGDVLPHVELPDTAGVFHAIDEFPDKYLLLDFWSRGCGPCVQSIPEAEEVARMYADTLVVVGISQDPTGFWKEFVTARGLKGVQLNGYSENGISLYDRFGSGSLPLYVLVSPQRKIISIWTGYGPGSLKSAVSQLIQSSTSQK